MVVVAEKDDDTCVHIQMEIQHSYLYVPWAEVHEDGVPRVLDWDRNDGHANADE